MMFAAGAFGASWLWLLALVVARHYFTWKGWSGWAELRLDGVNAMRVITRLGAGQPPSYASRVGLVVMGMYASGVVGFVLHAEIS